MLVKYRGSVINLSRVVEMYKYHESSIGFMGGNGVNPYFHLNTQAERDAAFADIFERWALKEGWCEVGL
jgi:hypothetical protein